MWSRVEAELILRGVARVNPIQDNGSNGEPNECIFCHATQGFGGLRHENDCAWVGAVRLLDELSVGPDPKISNPIRKKVRK